MNSHLMLDGLVLFAFAAGIFLAATGTVRPWMSYECVTGLVVMSVLIVAWWQEANAERLGSTSALEFLFVPLVPIGGFLIGKLSRAFRRQG